jgi:ParB/RepB/Spo0J family partition protein
MPKPNSDPLHRRIPIELLDEPPTPIRTAVDSAKLEALTENIKANGLLQPIGVWEHGTRYQIIFGHRRYLACRGAGFADVPCLVHTGDAIPLHAMMMNENADREELNPVDEAKFFRVLLDLECGGDTDVLRETVRRSRDYVETRLLLLEGDPQVLEALDVGVISIAVAKELNLFKDRGQRLQHLDAAVTGGASARIVREWRTKAESLQIARAASPAPEGMTPAVLEAPVGGSLVCVVCESDQQPYDLEVVYVHRSCRTLFLNRWLAALRGHGDPSSV